MSEFNKNHYRTPQWFFNWLNFSAFNRYPTSGIGFCEKVRGIL